MTGDNWPEIIMEEVRETRRSVEKCRDEIADLKDGLGKLKFKVYTMAIALGALAGEGKNIIERFIKGV